MTKTIVQLLHRGRFFFLVLWLVCVGASLWFLPKLEFQFALHPLLKGDTEQVKSVRKFYRKFPPAEGHAAVTVTWDHVVTVEDLRQAAAWAAQLEDLPEVRDVFSPASLLDLEFQGFTLDEWARLGGGGSEPLLMGDAPGMNTIRGRFISQDLKSVAFHVRRAGGTSTSDFLIALEEATAKWSQPARVVGTEMVLRDMERILRQNLLQLLALQLVALLVILPLFFRSLRTAYLPLLAAVSALLIFFGVMSAAGQALGLIYLAGPLLLMVIGLSDAIHLQQRFDDARAAGAGVGEALLLMFRSVGAACVLTSLTTAIGFLSLALSGHEEVKNFGIWCAIGVGIAFVTVMLFLPPALAFFPGKGVRTGLRSRLEPRRMQRLALPSIVLLTVAASGILFLRVDSSLMQELPARTPSVQDLNWFAENFQGTERIEVELKGPLDDPDLFAAVEHLQEQLEKQPGIIGSSSWTDLIRFMLPRAVVDTPDGPYLGLQALGSLGAFPENLLSRDGDHAAIVFYMHAGLGSREFASFEKRFHSLAADFPEEAEVKLTGYTTMAYHSVNLINNTLFKSFGLSLLSITVVLAVALRSPTLALICLVPNALPILVAAGCAGWMDIPLRLGMVIIFTVGLGLAVDDTIHLIVRFRQLRNESPGASVQTHLDESLRSAGFGVVLTSIVLLLSAMTFLNSDFSTLRETGVMLAVITVAALLSDLFIFPWLIEHSSRLKAIRRPTPVIDP